MADQPREIRVRVGVILVAGAILRADQEARAVARHRDGGPSVLFEEDEPDEEEVVVTSGRRLFTRWPHG